MIYLLWMWKNDQAANTAFENVPENEDKAMADFFSEEGMKNSGAEWVLYCDSAWADEEYRNWGITAYTSIEKRIEHTKAIQKLGWFRYANMSSLLGTLQMDEGATQTPPYPNPIYQLFITKANPVTLKNYSLLSKEEETALWEKWQESVKRTEACMVIYCKSGWSNEQHPGYGVMAFPNIEARQAHYEDLEKLNWHLYFDAFTVLGK
jgi:hypothetical protein